jgi:CheY-like chemotaxis protein
MSLFLYLEVNNIEDRDHSNSQSMINKAKEGKPMGPQILILGAGFGGLEAATSLSERLGSSADITLIDRNDYFIIGFSKFDVMFGRRSAEDVKSYYKNIAGKGINFIQDTIELIDPENKCVRTSSSEFTYDFLIIGLGADLVPDAIPGFAEDGYEFYSLDGAQKLFPVIDSFKAGTIVISIFDKPYKCPPAPYEAAFQLHDFLSQKGVRDNVSLKMLIPGPVPLPVAREASAEIERRLAERDIELLKQHKVINLNPDKKEATILVIEDEEDVRTLLADILTECGHQVVTASGGSQGIELFKENDFDLVFTDLGMPGVSGWQVAETIKSINDKTPVAVITGWNVELDKKEMKERGVNFIAHKPFEVDQILNLVSEGMELRKQFEAA